ncbi:hypothetical protein MOQ_004810 [Trypanosoma cruzi marinkellei]|uniref:Transmembrane protein n=1 Tax=Trypanosoma cruzi marinkellei TaxID=85056 RepID=K2N955_TRYCR|nr:hypothetical protein MOQ_004810 [Trypanosoma cruzi marinkellei]
MTGREDASPASTFRSHHSQSGLRGSASFGFSQQSRPIPNSREAGAKELPSHVQLRNRFMLFVCFLLILIFFTLSWRMSAAEKPLSPPSSESSAGKDVAVSAWLRFVAPIEHIFLFPKEMWACMADGLSHLPYTSSWWQHFGVGDVLLFGGPNQALFFAFTAAKAVSTYVQLFLTEELLPPCCDVSAWFLLRLGETVHTVGSKSVEGVRWVYIFFGLLSRNTTSPWRGRIHCTGITAVTTAPPSSPSLSTSAVNNAAPTNRSRRRKIKSGISNWLRASFRVLFSPKRKAPPSPPSLLRSVEGGSGLCGMSRGADPPAKGSRVSQEPQPSSKEASQSETMPNTQRGPLEKTCLFLKWLTGGFSFFVSEPSGKSFGSKREMIDKKSWMPKKGGVAIHSRPLSSRNLLGRSPVSSSKASEHASEATRKSNKEKSVSLTRAASPDENNDKAIVRTVNTRILTGHHFEFAVYVSSEPPHKFEDKIGREFTLQALQGTFIRDVAHLFSFAFSIPIENISLRRNGNIYRVGFDVLQLPGRKSWTKREIGTHENEEVPKSTTEGESPSEHEQVLESEVKQLRDYHAQRRMQVSGGFVSDLEHIILPGKNLRDHRTAFCGKPESAGSSAVTCGVNLISFLTELYAYSYGWLKLVVLDSKGRCIFVTGDKLVVFDCRWPIASKRSISEPAEADDISEEYVKFNEVHDTILLDDLSGRSERKSLITASVFSSDKCSAENGTVVPSSAHVMTWMYASVVFSGIFCAAVATGLCVLAAQRSLFHRRGDGEWLMTRWQLARSELLLKALDERSSVILEALPARFNVPREEVFFLRRVVQAYFASCESHYIDGVRSIVMREQMDLQRREAAAQYTQEVFDLNWSFQLHEVMLLEEQHRLKLCVEEGHNASQLLEQMMAVSKVQLEYFVGREEARAAAAVRITCHADTERVVASCHSDDNSDNMQDTQAASSPCSFSFAETLHERRHESGGASRLEELLFEMLLSENREKHALRLELCLLRRQLAEYTEGNFDRRFTSCNVMESNGNDKNVHCSVLERNLAQQ